MKFLISILLILFPLSALADFLQATDPSGVTVTLHMTPCASELIDVKRQEMNIFLRQNEVPEVEKMNSGKFFIDGKERDACWSTLNNNVLVLDDTYPGDGVWVVPMPAFRVVQEI